MKTLLEGIIEGFVREYTDAQKQKMGIPLDVVARGGKWYRGDVYAGKVVNGKFVSAQEKPEDEPDSRDPAAGKQNFSQAIATDPELAALNKQAGSGDSVTRQTHTSEVQSWAYTTRKGAEERTQFLKDQKTSADKLATEILRDLNKTRKPKIKKDELFDYIDPNDRFDLQIGNDIKSISASELKEMVEAKNPAGQMSSLASEALTVDGMQRAIELIRSNPDMSVGQITRAVIEDIQKNYPDDGVLDDKWKNASYGQVYSTLSGLKSSGYELSDIDDVYWDSGAGNKLAGTTGHETSSDFFVKMKDGNVVGVSLKKDGDIIFANLGTKGFVDRILSELPENDPARKTLQNIVQREIVKARKTIESDPNIIKNINKVGQKICNNPVEAEKVFGVNHQTYCSTRKSAVEKLNSGETLSGAERKFVSRLLEKSGRPEFEEVSRIYRDIDSNIAKAMIKASKNSPEFKRQLSLTVVEGLHVAEHLGLVRKPPPNKMITSFGTGTVIDREKIYDLFEVSTEDRKKIESLVMQAANDPEKIRDVESFFADRIILEPGNVGFKANLDIEGTGVTIAELGIRSKGAGTLPNTLITPSKALRGKLGGSVGKKLKNFGEVKKLLRNLIVSELDKLYGN